MKTYVKIIILIATLGIGFGIGWFCREQMFDASFTQVVGQEVQAEKLGGESNWKPGMQPTEFLRSIKTKLFEI